MAMFLALCLLAISSVGLAAAQTNGVLLAGQTLPQVVCPLFSPRAAAGHATYPALPLPTESLCIEARTPRGGSTC